MKEADNKRVSLLEVPMASSFKFDVTRGVDVMRGKEVVAHFDGADALEQACAQVAAGNGRYVRYWE